MELAFGGRPVEALRTGYRVDVDQCAGAGTLRVPVTAPAGRNGLGPSLTLGYSSRGNNSAFGAGWSLDGLPAITLDTRFHVPRWDGTDGYQLAGDELVPWLDETAAWAPRGFVSGDWSVAFLRSRRGSVKTRVEKWVYVPTGRVHFRTRDPRNVVTVYGARARAVHRDDVARVARAEVHAAGGDVNPLFDARLDAAAPAPKEGDRPIAADEASRRPGSRLIEPRHELVAGELVTVCAVPAGHVETCVEGDRGQAVETPTSAERRVVAARRVAERQRRAESVASRGRGDRDTQRPRARALIDVDTVARAQRLNRPPSERKLHGSDSSALSYVLLSQPTYMTICALPTRFR